MEYTIHYQEVQDYEYTIEADSPKEALQSVLEQWDKDEYWPFLGCMEPWVIKAYVEDEDGEVPMRIESDDEHPVYTLRKLAGMEQK